MSRSSSSSGKGVWINLIIGQEGDSGPVHSFKDRRMGLLFILSASDRRDAMRRESEKLVEKSRFAVIAAVVVGDRNQVKTCLKQATIGACIAAKVIRLRYWDTQSRDDTLQVANREIEAT